MVVLIIKHDELRSWICSDTQLLEIESMVCVQEIMLVVWSNGAVACDIRDIYHA